MASEIRSFLQDSLTSADFDDIVHRSESEVATDDGVTFGTIMLGRLASQSRSTSQVQRVSSLQGTISVAMATRAPRGDKFSRRRVLSTAITISRSTCRATRSPAVKTIF